MKRHAENQPHSEYRSSVDKQNSVFRLPTALCLLMLAFLACAHPPRIYIRPQTDLSEIKRIAVLPFDNLSGEQDAGEKITEIFTVELLRMGKSASEAYYLSRVIGPVADEEFGGVLENVGQTGYPRGRVAYTVERAAIQIRDLPGGMILILLTFFASLFAFVWASDKWGNASAETIFFVALGLIAAGALMLISAVFIVTFIRSINK